MTTIDEWLSVHPFRRTSATRCDDRTRVTLTDEYHVSVFGAGGTRDEAEREALREYESHAIAEQARTAAR